MERRFVRVKMDIIDVNEANIGILHDSLKHLRGQIIQVERESFEHLWNGGNELGRKWNWLEEQLEFFPDGKVIDNAPESST